MDRHNLSKAHLEKLNATFDGLNDNQSPQIRKSKITPSGKITPTGKITPCGKCDKCLLADCGTCNHCFDKKNKEFPKKPNFIE